MEKQEQQQGQLAAAPKERKEAPWWDFFRHCKEAAYSEDEDDDISHDDRYPNSPIIAANFASDQIINDTPLSPHAIIRKVPVKLISSDRSNVVGDDSGAAHRDTPATQDSSFFSTEISSSTSLLHDNENDDALDKMPAEYQSIKDSGKDVEEGERECRVVDDMTSDSPSLTSISASSIAISPLQNDAERPKQLSQSITEVEKDDIVSAAAEQQCQNTTADLLDDFGDGTINSNSDDDCSFIGNIEIMPISHLLSTHHRNIRKNAYNLLKRLGEEESFFDLNSVEVEQEEEDNDDDYEQPRQERKQQLKHEEVQQNRECTDMVIQLQVGLRNSSCDATNDDKVLSEGINHDDRKTSMAELHAEISSLRNKLEEVTMELMVVKKENHDLTKRLMSVGKDNEKESEEEMNESLSLLHSCLCLLSLEREANSSSIVASSPAGGAADDTVDVSLKGSAVDVPTCKSRRLNHGQDFNRRSHKDKPSFKASSANRNTINNTSRTPSAIMHQSPCTSSINPILSLSHNNYPSHSLDLLLDVCGLPSSFGS